MKFNKEEEKLIKVVSEALNRYGVVSKFEFEERITELEEKISHLPDKEEFFNSQDKLISELKVNREDRPAGAWSASDWRAGQTVQAHQISRHEDRLNKVERKLNIASV